MNDWKEEFRDKFTGETWGMFHLKGSFAHILDCIQQLLDKKDEEFVEDLMCMPIVNDLEGDYDVVPHFRVMEVINKYRGGIGKMNKSMGSLIEICKILNNQSTPYIVASEYAELAMACEELEQVLNKETMLWEWQIKQPAKEG